MSSRYDIVKGVIPKKSQEVVIPKDLNELDPLKNELNFLIRSHDEICISPQASIDFRKRIEELFRKGQVSRYAWKHLADMYGWKYPQHVKRNYSSSNTCGSPQSFSNTCGADNRGGRC